MSHLSRSRLSFCAMAILIGSSHSLSAVSGMPVIDQRTQNNPKSSISNDRMVADSSDPNSTQYNPYLQDEANSLNQTPSTEVYYNGSNPNAAGYGAAAAVGAELNEANQRNNRAAAEGAARHSDTYHHHSGHEGHHAEGFGAANHPRSQGHSMEQRHSHGGHGGHR